VKDKLSYFFKYLLQDRLVVVDCLRDQSNESFRVYIMLPAGKKDFTAFYVVTSAVELKLEAMLSLRSERLPIVTQYV